MENNINVQNEEKIIKPNNKREIYVLLFKFLIIGLIALTIFAYLAKDRGSWEFIYYFLAFPFFFVIGFIALKSSIKLLKKEKNLPTYLLLIFSIIFITWAPAVKISQGIQYIMFYKTFQEEKITAQKQEITDLNNISESFSYYFNNPVVIDDVEKDRIYINNNNGSFIFLVTNAEKIGLLNNPESFKNKTVKLILDKDFLSKKGRDFSSEGSILISRNNSEQLKEYNDYIAKYPGQWNLSDWYGGIENKLFIATDLPVIINQ